MDVLLDTADLRRLLLDNLEPTEICDFVESRKDLHRNKIEQDYNYWVKRIFCQYKIPEKEVINLLHATPEIKQQAECVNNNLPLGDTPYDIFLFLTPGQTEIHESFGAKCRVTYENWLPGCAISATNYGLLSHAEKERYPLAKYNYEPPRLCVYIFQRPPKRDQQCGLPVAKGQLYCSTCMKRPQVIKMLGLPPPTSKRTMYLH